MKSKKIPVVKIEEQVVEYKPGMDILSVEPRSPMEKAAHLVELEAMQKDIRAKIDQYKVELLDITQKQNVISLKTGNYTITRVRKFTPQVLDVDLLKKALKEADIPFSTHEEFDAIMNVPFKMLAKEGRHMDGLNVLETEFIMVRINPEKGNYGEAVDGNSNPQRETAKSLNRKNS